ncbi:MAG: hypothetical protein WCX12_00525 [Candidatus Paceibacterota bacterium]|jgi:hypothetical protein
MKFSADNIRKIDKEDFWKLSGGEDRIKFLLRYGVLAPSTHNSQPWLFKIFPSSVEIYYNKEKEIIEADPHGRDLFISFGCLIENIVTAASFFGVDTEVKYLPAKEVKNELIATIVFSNLKNNDFSPNKDDSLLNIIKTRINARGIFENKTISPDTVNKLISLNEDPNIKINFITDKKKINRIAELTELGLHEAYARKKFRMEMSKWLNHNLSSKKEGIPGFSLRMSLLISLAFPKLVKFLNVGKAVGVLNYKSAASAPGIVIIGSKDNQPETFLKVGRIAERLMLHCKLYNLKTSIFLASIEMGDYWKEIQKITENDFFPQFIFCIGYLNYNQKYNFRYRVEEKIIK